jgi:hypothetical protein
MKNSMPDDDDRSWWNFTLENRKFSQTRILPERVTFETSIEHWDYKLI